MILPPITRDWLRNPWLVAALVAIAIASCPHAISRIRDIQAQAKFDRNFSELVTALNSMKR